MSVGWSEVGIYKRKNAFDQESDQEKRKNKENKLSTKKATKKKKTFFFS